MLGFTSLLLPQVFFSSKPVTVLIHNPTLSFPYFPLKFRTPNTPRTPSSFTLFAQNGESDSNNRESSKESVTEKLNGSVNGGEGGGSDDSKRDPRPLFNLRWSDLLYPDADNFLAVGLAGLFTWASVQV
ncbi:uncharacterized protein LOC110809120 [Carica papaya]|uniref:uncharacterized protein LOC110809120 n=1 Tax=Carica papaya TaxID=3649 RepID=UPI000B8CE6E9|nr:uncharacterized protein LOC110809120 [Carica papaya]